MKKQFLLNFYKSKYRQNELDMNFLCSIPEFNILSSCEQNPRWHKEGNVMNHTILVYETLQKVLIKNTDIYFSLTEEELLILRVATLLHDIGKGVTTSTGKDGKWHAYGHELEGEKIARVLLWDENIYIREDICSLIRYHMEPLRIFDSKNWLNKMLEIGTRVSWKLLYLLKMSDILGSIQEFPSTTDEDLIKLEFLKETAISLGIWDKKCNDTLKKVAKYSNKKSLLPWKNKINNDKVAYIMIGLSGAGKNTYINDRILTIHDDVVQISRDDIRVQLGYCLEGEKYLGTEDEEKNVTNMFVKLFNDAMDKGSTIVLNNTNLKKKYRDSHVSSLRDNGYIIKFVYVEAPTLEVNYERRSGEVPKDVIDKMALSLEWPEVTEYDELIIAKQTR